MKSNLKLIAVIYFILLIIPIAQTGCNSVEPSDTIEPGRRDYIWTADTLWTDEFESFGVTDVWGSSPNSIWLTATVSQAQDRLWYYDGIKWLRYNLPMPNGTFYTIFGAVPNEIWIGNTESSIWRNRGNGWEEFQKISVEGYDQVIISSINGTAKNNLYAVGVAQKSDGSDYKGIILKYNGTDWKFLNIPYIKVGFLRIKKMSNGKYLIWGENSDNGFLEKLYVFDGGTLKEIYSDYHYPGMNEMNGETYVTINKKIYKCKNNKLEFWKGFPGSSYYGTVLGRSEKDFFGSGTDGIYHYNGTDLVNLYPTQGLDLYGALIFGKDVFFNGYHYEKRINVMIRGTLKE